MKRILPKRKFITRLLICVVVGLIASVGIAWLAVATVDVSESWEDLESTHSLHSNTAWFYEIAQESAYIAISSTAEKVGSANLGDGNWRNKYWWSRVNTKPEVSDTYSIFWFVEEAWGFPMVCVLSKWKITAGEQFVQTGIPFSTRTLPYSRSYPKLFPVQPIWKGLLVNTAIYSIVTWIGIVLFVRTRKSHRRKRGLCIYCRYIVRDLPICPECGNGLISKCTRIKQHYVANFARDA